MNILAIGAHPDDIEFGCGGSLIKYAAKGENVFLLVMSKGEMGGDPDIRAGEQEAAEAVLGAKDLFWGGLVDTRVDISRDTIQRIESVIQKSIRTSFSVIIRMILIRIIAIWPR